MEILEEKQSEEIGSGDEAELRVEPAKPASDPEPQEDIHDPNGGFEAEPPVSGPQPVDTITFRRSHLYALLLPLAFVLGLSVGFIFWGREAPPQEVRVVTPSPDNEENTSSAGAQGAQPALPRDVRRYEVPIGDDYVLGPDDAPITLIEFSDYECPYCQRFHAEVLKDLLASYPGQIRFVYRDFPLSQIHPNAFPAAMAANCAGEQGNYYEYHDKLFSNQYGLNDAAYEQYAFDLGLDMTTFLSCLETFKYQEEVQEDFEFAANLGVSSTPTFFINGIPLVGAQPLSVFVQVIDQELAGGFD